jgi:hypothetical protein
MPNRIELADETGAAITDSNPLAVSLVGGGTLSAEYNSTPPVLTNGEETPLQTNSSGDLKVSLTNAGTSVPIFTAFEYETVAASQTAQVIGATGAAGDYLSHVVVSPAVAACGVVTILDNATTIVAFPGGGTTALSNLIPFVIPVGMKSVSGAWKITTGANVSCAAVGDFT